MKRRYGNFWAQRAARLTALAHRRQPHVKWLVFLGLATVWIGAGFVGWASAPPGDAFYKTLGALTVQGSYEEAASQNNVPLQVARYAGVLLPFVGILFAFSGQLGRALAGLYMVFASRHIVIVGRSPAAFALARSSVAAGDVVALIAADLPAETAWSLRQSGIILYEGDGDRATLHSARAHRADHFVALTGDDASNLKVEAILRAVIASAAPSRRRTIAAHVAIESPLLLIEAREMRMIQQRERDSATGAKARPEPIDPRPFSLDEIAARDLLSRDVGVILGVAETQQHQRPHLVIFGFDRAAESIAVRSLMSLWSVHFDAPRVTVITPDPDAASEGFSARYPQAVAHDVWRADIAFIPFDWRTRPLDLSVLDFITQQRGPPSAVVVSTGSDADSIQLAFGILRTANIAGVWRAPVYLKEDSQSEFTAQFARKPNTTGATLKAFGAVEATATRALLIEGRLDAGAAVAHQVYLQNMATREEVDRRKLEAIGKSWSTVGETYRSANRAAADSAMVKAWDFGWRPARATEPGVAAPVMDDSLMMRMAEVEHARWSAERLLSGWRPGETRDNSLLVHNNLVAWHTLTPELKQRDVDQVVAAMMVARITHPGGFMPDPRATS